MPGVLGIVPSLVLVMADQPAALEGSRPYDDALKFRLAGFLSVAWASATAQGTWAPVLARTRDLLNASEVASVADGGRRCALFAGMSVLPLPLDELRSAMGLSWAVLGEPWPSVGHYFLTERSTARRPHLQAVIVAKSDDVSNFVHAWYDQDDITIDGLLGTPGCCAALTRQLCADGQLLDPTWAFIHGRASGAVGTAVTVPAGDARFDITNVLWRWLGVRAVPYFPCHHACTATAAFSRMLRACLPTADNAAWGRLDEILSWPVEWSTLHGIAEVKTPVLKFRTASDATAGKYTVQWEAGSFPLAGAVGLGFPYRAERSHRPARVDLGPTIRTKRRPADAASKVTEAQ